eukprot:c28531_g2_i1 orf=190-468(+)
MIQKNEVEKLPVQALLQKKLIEADLGPPMMQSKGRTFDTTQTAPCHLTHNRIIYTIKFRESEARMSLLHMALLLLPKKKEMKLTCGLPAPLQ